ncbi:MAG: PUR family DNA/RNA-binding protein [Verrucomicrobia bacterium]|nr:PUR family DNA/RNA-binding protein [Cytophagales bacterium]
MVEEDNKDKVEIYSKRVRAGKRTYFFDVKSTRGNDYYLTITESKRRYREDGFVYEKHKIFLYKEDFEKFLENLKETIEHVKNELMPEVDFSQFDRKEEGDVVVEEGETVANETEVIANEETDGDTDRLRWD